MKKFLIAAISCILLYLLLDTAYYRWGIYFDFHKEQDIEVFAATQGKEILLDTGSGMEPFEIRGVDMGWGFRDIIQQSSPLIRRHIFGGLA